jgi:hypothetical protein
VALVTLEAVGAVHGSRLMPTGVAMQECPPKTAEIAIGALTDEIMAAVDAIS